jgi:hypothetical protein
METDIYVFNSAGCHGHYLTYLIDRFSKKTPTITELPFNNVGNSHKDIKYSGFSFFVDVSEHNNYKDLKNQKIIKIIYDKDILYFERVAMNRAGDSNRDINNLHRDISFLKTYNNKFYNTIYKLYSIKNDSVPLWLLRDAYKLGFLNWNNQGSVVSSKQDIKWIKDNLKNNNVYFLNVTAFFDTKTLKNELQKLSNMFELDLSLENLEETHLEFIKNNKILQTHKYTDIVLDAIKEQKNIEIPTLDIIQQAFIYAELEKKYDFITMPLVDNFFKTTAEIFNYVNYYPTHYKAMNPNLPTFNNIPNPFFLHRQKTK